MSKQLISRVETITPVLAEEYLRHNTSNRQLRKNIVNYYASQMKSGQWMLNGEGIIFNEQGTLVDGQHRLAAVVESGVNVDMLVVRNADKDSFATIDSGVSRKIADTFYVKGVPNANHISSIIGRYIKLTNGQTAGSTSTTKMAHSSSRQDLLRLYAENEEFWQNVCRFADACYRPMRLIKASELGGYIAYLLKVKNHPQEKVYGFFEDLLVSDIPRSPMLAALRKRLVSDATSTSHMLVTYRQQLVVKVWNAYIKGKEITLMRWNEEQEGKKEFI